MTVSYSLDVSKARFCGFAKLLARWKGGIYKILWREFCVFCTAYAAVSLIYRQCLDEKQKLHFEKVVIYVNTFTDLIPLSFVLGFYVSLVIGRWWGQYEAIPWPDRVCFSIASFIHGSDERSRMIRRTLGRYVILAQALTFQCVSTSVKRRFPSTQHLVAAGIMTKEEQAVYEKTSFSHGKWWLPCHWFTSLASRAMKEGRIKDSILFNGLLKEMYEYRTNCAIMFGYDWISVPLVYTQVVTIATYLYCLALIIGRQFLDPVKGYPAYDVDLYIPFFTLLQFFFYVGWLKVAEQILNPYGEDDDDFELNWCLDRTVHLVYLTVDTHRLRHPKVTKDDFWDETEILLPQTKHTAKMFRQPEMLGSATNLEVEEAEYVPMETLLEQDADENVYKGNSVRRKDEYRPSLIRRLLSSKAFGQSRRRKTIRREHSTSPGFTNQAFEDGGVEKNTAANQKRPSSAPPSTSLNNAVALNTGRTRNSSISFRPNSLSLHKRKTYDLRDAERTFHHLQGMRSAPHSPTGGGECAVPVSRTVSAPARADSGDIEQFLESDREDPKQDNLMPSIPEEWSRAPSLASALGGPGLVAQEVQELVVEANQVIGKLSKTISASQSEIAASSDAYEPDGSAYEEGQDRIPQESVTPDGDIEERTPPNAVAESDRVYYVSNSSIQDSSFPVIKIE